LLFLEVAVDHKFVSNKGSPHDNTHFSLLFVEVAVDHFLELEVSVETETKLAQPRCHHHDIIKACMV
jgi:hypothetical protein